MSRASETRRVPTQASWRRRVLRALSVLVGLGALGIGIVFLRPDWAEKIANGLRAALGPSFVARLEDLVYTTRDEVLLHTRGRGRPDTYWAPSAPAALAPDVPSPPAFEPPHHEVAAPDDGRWSPVVDDLDPNAPVMFKALVHPDPERARAAVALLAIRASGTRLHLFAGTHEPDVGGIPRDERPGVVPESMHANLLAIWSGGFRTINGRYGMRVGPRTYHPPRRTACTLAIRRDGRVAVGTWAELSSMESEIEALRQAPPCLLVDGGIGPGVERDDSHIWGVSVQGTTIIRRSGFGVTTDGAWWVYAIGDELTTKALAMAMRVAGVADAMLLDVNEAPTRCLFYHRSAGGLVADSWLPRSMVKEGMYITRPWERDFFALTRETEPANGAAP